MDETPITKPMDTPPAEFYGKEDSCYVKFQYNAETEMFRVEVRNELLHALGPQEPPEGIKTLTAFVRGMLEIALNNPHEVYRVGIIAINEDVIRMSDDIPEDQRNLLSGKPAGNA